MFDNPDLPDQLARAIEAFKPAQSSDFDLNADRPPAQNLRAAAVLVPLHFAQDRWNVILTKRPASMKHHPGQIAFPGGKHELSDTSLEFTALREAREEIGVDDSRVQIIGALPNHETVTNFDVSPFLGIIPPDTEFVKERYEVEELFLTPLEFLLNTENFIVQSRNWFGSERFYYTIPYGPYYIWGATARMLFTLATIWSNANEN